MKIFISSLISGFEPLRAAAKAAVKSLGHEPVMAEDFGARPQSPQIACLQELRSSDLVVLILGDRYGSVPDGSTVSPTHEEYLEARGSKQILLFVQDPINREDRQAQLISDAQGWQKGLFRDAFTNAEDLREKITRHIHRFELAHAAGPIDAAALVQAADALLPSSRGDRHSGAPVLRFALVGGPARQILRPAELEAEELGSALHQRAMFSAPKIFDPAKGVERDIVDDALIVRQADAASVRLDERGGIALSLPLTKNGGRGHMGSGDHMFAIIEESVVAGLSSAIGFANWVLDHIDATQRITHVGLSARIDAADYMGWRTQAEQNASPNSGSMRMGNAPRTPAHFDRPRPALTFDAQRIAEDLMVPLRRQW